MTHNEKKDDCDQISHANIKSLLKRAQLLQKSYRVHFTWNTDIMEERIKTDFVLTVLQSSIHFLTISWDQLCQDQRENKDVLKVMEDWLDVPARKKNLQAGYQWHCDVMQHLEEKPNWVLTDDNMPKPQHTPGFQWQHRFSWLSSKQLPEFRVHEATCTYLFLNCILSKMLEFDNATENKLKKADSKKYEKEIKLLDKHCIYMHERVYESISCIIEDLGKLKRSMDPTQQAALWNKIDQNVMISKREMPEVMHRAAQLAEHCKELPPLQTV